MQQDLDAFEALLRAAERDERAATAWGEAEEDVRVNRGFRSWLLRQPTCPPPAPWPSSEEEVRGLSARPKDWDDEDEDDDEGSSAEACSEEHGGAVGPSSSP